MPECSTVCAVASGGVSGGCSELSPLAVPRAASSLWPLLDGGGCGSSGHCRLSLFQLSLKHDQIFLGPSGAPGVQLTLARSCHGFPYTGWVIPCSFPTSSCVCHPTKCELFLGIPGFVLEVTVRPFSWSWFPRVAGMSHTGVTMLCSRGRAELSCCW